MFGSLGLPEILFILVLALLLFGPKRLPEIGRTIGKGLSEFRRASNELKRTLDAEVAAEDAPRKPQPVPPAFRQPPPKATPPEAPKEAEGGPKSSADAPPAPAKPSQPVDAGATDEGPGGEPAGSAPGPPAGER